MFHVMFNRTTLKVISSCYARINGHDLLPRSRRVVIKRGLQSGTMSWTKASTVFSEGLAKKRDIICGDMLQKINRKEM